MNPEHGHEAQRSHEDSAELASLGRERLEQLSHDNEAGPESREERAEAAREALKSHEQQTTPAETASLPAAKHPFAARLDQLVSYRQTVQSLQRQLDPVSRQFSRIIHNDAVDSASEALGRTVFRPSIVTGGLWGAVIVGAIFYLSARHYGFELSGSEMLIALVAGGLFGYVFEIGLRAFGRRH